MSPLNSDLPELDVMLQVLRFDPPHHIVVVALTAYCLASADGASLHVASGMMVVGESIYDATVVAPLALIEVTVVPQIPFPTYLDDLMGARLGLRVPHLLFTGLAFNRLPSPR